MPGRLSSGGCGRPGDRGRKGVGVGCQAGAGARAARAAQPSPARPAQRSRTRSHTPHHTHLLLHVFQQHHVPRLRRRPVALAGERVGRPVGQRKHRRAGGGARWSGRQQVGGRRQEAGRQASSPCCLLAAIGNLPGLPAAPGRPSAHDPHALGARWCSAHRSSAGLSSSGTASAALDRSSSTSWKATASLTCG